MPSIHQILKTYWGYSEFRPLQEEIITAVLSGKDTLAIMPTGGGKSLCYQVPALLNEGICLVVSPLIALMKDQVENLRRKNITAFAIYSGMSRKEVINTFKVAGDSNCKLLYVSPERLESSLFKEYLPSLNIRLIAVDEAHCISQWGYDFRPSYLRIANLREELPQVPILALTASATPAVQNDICDNLLFTGRTIFRQSFARANLSYSAFKVDSKIRKISEILKKVSGSSIVYCKSRKRTKEISELLQLENIAADFYHAGLEQEQRNKKQNAWIENKSRVIVCTNAFGMGIDKPDVRTVIHADAPDCLENYYQEAGRAGRDGNKAYAVLLFDDKDVTDLSSMAALRFPSLNEIRKIYQLVANYLQIPTQSGEGNYYDFDLADFVKKFKQTSHTTLFSLKALEQDGWLSFNEQVFIPASLKFTTNKKDLYEFENNYPQLEPCIKTLLRSYEGIFDQYTHISEKLLSSLLNIPVSDVIEQLTSLDQLGIISYQAQKDTPQLYLLQNRVKAEDVTINMVAYSKRKDQFLLRMKQMIQYVKDETDCRSRIIGLYFGDSTIKECGICDNCLKKKATNLSKEEFENIHNRIVHLLNQLPLHTKELLENLADIKKDKVWKVLEFLQAEKIVEVNENGWVTLK